MEEKEVEKRLKEGAENIEVRDFSEVWQDIEHKVQPPKKRRYVRLFSGIAAALSIIIICAVFIPLYLNPAPEQSENDQTDGQEQVVYFDDELAIFLIDGKDFSSTLADVNINVVDISGYVVSSSYLYKAADQKILGGHLELTDNLDNPTFFLVVQMYHQSVQSRRPTVDYDYNYTVEGTVIEYRVKEAYPEEGVYIYDIKAKYLQTNYYMEYTCFSEDITSFLTDFFTE